MFQPTPGKPPFRLSDHQARALFLECAHSSNSNLMKRLLESEVTWTGQAAYGETPLHIAAERGHIETVKLLIKKEFNPNHKDLLGRNAGMLAVQGKQLKVLLYLLKRGMSPNVKDKNGTTLLMWACALKELDTVKILINRGAAVNAKDSKGRTALDYVRFDFDSMEITRFLVAVDGKKGSHSRTEGDLRKKLFARKMNQLRTLQKTAGYPWGNPFALRKKAARKSFLESYLLFLEKKFAEAEKSLSETMVTEVTGCGSCLTLKAKIDARRRLYEDSNECLETLKKMNISGSPLNELMFFLGESAFRNNDFGFAATYFYALPAEYAATFPELNYYQGYLADQNNRLDTARKFYKTYLADNPQGTFSEEADTALSELGPGVIPVRDQEGQRLDMAHYSDTWVLIDFWSVVNDHGEKRFKILQKMKKSLKAYPFELISINVDSDKQQALDSLLSFQGDWAQYFDPGYSWFGHTYGLQETPSAILFNPAGQNVQVFHSSDFNKPKKITSRIKKMMK
jgi:hypothetical protein